MSARPVQITNNWSPSVCISVSGTAIHRSGCGGVLLQALVGVFLRKISSCLLTSCNPLFRAAGPPSTI